MNVKNEPDRQFHENLQTLGRYIDADAEPSETLRTRCLAELDVYAAKKPRRILTMMRKPALLSITGVAAAIVILIVVLFPGAQTPTVQAATIMRQLNEQIERNPNLEIRLEQLGIDEVFINGSFIIGEGNMFGDMAVRVDEDPSAEEHVIELDLAFALRPIDGWALIRSIRIPDPEIRKYLDGFFLEGTETMFLLPNNLMNNKRTENLDFGMITQHIQQIHEVLKQIAASHEEYGMTLTPQSDGTILLTLPIKDAAALQSLVLQFDKQLQLDIESDIKNEAHDTTNTDNEINEAAESDTKSTSNSESSCHRHDQEVLLGATIAVVYDPATERARSLAILDFGAVGSNIRVNLDAPSPAGERFDWQNYMKPETRLFDMHMFESMIQQCLNAEE